MPKLIIPSRFEPLQETFGEQVPTILVRVEKDLELFSRIGVTIQTARQGKLVFLYGEPGVGKSTAGYSLPIFLPDFYSSQIRVPPPWELPHEQIPTFIYKSVPRQTKGITVVTIDRRETPDIDVQVFRSVLMQLNGMLRDRADLLLLWPVNDPDFANRAVATLQQFGGQSAFATEPIVALNGVPREQFRLVLERMLNVAGWDLSEAAVTWAEVDAIAADSPNVGTFLDRVQNLVSQRTNLKDKGVQLPTLVFAISSDGTIQQVCRGLRRADTFYIEANRLLMHTRESNIAQWWKARENDPQSCLPYIVSMFQAQLVSLSPSSVVYAAGLFGTEKLKGLAVGPVPNRGNARSAMKSTEFYKYFAGRRDRQHWGGQRPSPKTLEAYRRIQAVSKEDHKDINRAILTLALDAGLALENIQYEQQLTAGGLQTDVTAQFGGVQVAIEFHHKAATECKESKIAVYVLEKLKAYAIDYRLAQP